ncbi:MAG: acetamidase/formamidase family protein [Methylobacteriaceae bacterium]|nr:acetamidase/formamidase family protein [Methylobacteriaceae bacterium]MBV9244657.1 acetamidase/formamidase family protein [Methylobacteriaceae bacterium]MBV9634040.1 acetamidase/formamidase family protein [Methylobacteriaceae bacterium]MBV9701621.1 acetamidase/formamidase family protein [Methylobacteriaceae bacterium]
MRSSGELRGAAKPAAAGQSALAIAPTSNGAGLCALDQGEPPIPVLHSRVDLFERSCRRTGAFRDSHPARLARGSTFTPASLAARPANALGGIDRYLRPGVEAGVLGLWGFSGGRLLASRKKGEGRSEKRITTLIPRAFCGNIDIKELIPGATLFLPVFVTGARAPAR